MAPRRDHDGLARDDERPMKENSSMTTPFIQVKELSVAYDGNLAIRRVDFTVEEGEFVAILGPSGCGKSTFLHVLAGLLRPSAGVAEIQGKRVSGAVTDLPPIGYVFQDHRLLPWRTVAQNLQIVLAAVGIPKAEWEERIDRYLKMLQIDRFRSAWPMQMSGGQRQRVSIARALAIDPAVVLMDEPFSTLDEVTARTLRQELLDVWEQNRRTVLFVTHSIREALFLADRILVLTRGPAEILKEISVDIPRPRLYEDPALTERESTLVDEVMEPWGYVTKDQRAS
jgi:NitT/TauT family transport system ATP-binding protein